MRFPLKDPASAHAGESLARVIVTHGQLLRVRTADSQELLARPAYRDLRVVCGDVVRLRHDARHNELHVVAIEARSGALYRSNARGASEIIAAHLTLLLVVVAPLPQPDFFVVDRYLAAARSAGIEALVLLNKSELPVEAQIGQELSTFAAAGYAHLAVSALQGAGLAALQARLTGETAMLAGQSGTGKSSLLRALVPQTDAAVGALMRDHTGRHTTTTTRLYSLPQGGELLDSPGVRDFAPALDRLEPRALGFPEIEALSPQCRFADCRHLQEPDCAVRAALQVSLSARRYESYRRLRRLHDRLGPHGAP